MIIAAVVSIQVYCDIICYCLSCAKYSYELKSVLSANIRLGRRNFQLPETVVVVVVVIIVGRMMYMYFV